MSAKNLDKHNRWRSKTIGFHISPEENEELNRIIRLSGLTKQDYILSRLMNRDIVVEGNRRFFVMLRDYLMYVYNELKRIETGNAVDDELLELIRMIIDYAGKLKEEANA